jgi:hypothetical protein
VARPLVSDVSQTGILQQVKMQTEPVTTKPVGLTLRSWSIADNAAAAANMTRNEWLEWVVLCQQYESGQAETYLAQRRKRGRNWETK